MCCTDRRKLFNPSNPIRVRGEAADLSIHDVKLAVELRQGTNVKARPGRDRKVHAEATR